MQRIELASLFEAPSAFQTLGKRELKYLCALFDLVAGHRKYEVHIFGWSCPILGHFSR